ncbi:MAG: RNA polymerase sigma factor [Acidobacteria bacterium]|nr:RNA polymerase sigma factor [Acidobacteriota bacterium]
MPVQPVMELAELFRAHHALVLKAAYRVTGSMSDAEDVLQTVFLRLAGRDFSQASVANIQGYLHRAAVNAGLDVVRARQEGRQQALDDRFELPSTGAFGSPERQRASAEIRAWLENALLELSPRAAEAFALRYLEELDNQEIARLLGMTETAIGVLLHRTRAQLQKDYEKKLGSKAVLGAGGFHRGADGRRKQ